MKLIDADALKEAMWSLVINENDDIPVLNAIGLIDKAKPVKLSLLPADESKEEAYMQGYNHGKAEGLLKAPTRQKGEWIPMNPDCRGYSDYFKCSRCGAYIYPSIAEKELDYNGCPYCFADMRGEE